MKYIQSGAKTKPQHFKIDILLFIFNKIHQIIYQIKQKWMNFMMGKSLSKNILK